VKPLLLFGKLCHQKLIKFAAIIGGLFIAALAYLEYQRILNVDWHRIQAVSQNGIDWVANALTHVSSTIGASQLQKILWKHMVGRYGERIMRMEKELPL
jgi:uncharacterized membrane protein (Fun14 family)